MFLLNYVTGRNINFSCKCKNKAKSMLNAIKMNNYPSENIFPVRNTSLYAILNVGDPNGF